MSKCFCSRVSRHRGARNTVSWSSVIGVADGHWSGPGMWTTTCDFVTAVAWTVNSLFQASPSILL